MVFFGINFIAQDICLKLTYQNSKQYVYRTVQILYSLNRSDWMLCSEYRTGDQQVAKLPHLSIRPWVYFWPDGLRSTVLYLSQSIKSFPFKLKVKNCIKIKCNDENFWRINYSNNNDKKWAFYCTKIKETVKPTNIGFRV